MIESRPTFFKHVQRKTGLWVPAPLRFAGGYPCCGGASHCANCSGSGINAPEEFEVRITVPPGLHHCQTECETWAGTYILGSTSTCRWEIYLCPKLQLGYQGSCTLLVIARIVLMVKYYPASGNWTIEVQMQRSSGQVHYWWDKQYTFGKPSCLTLNNLSLTWNSNVSMMSCWHGAGPPLGCFVTAL